MIDLISRADVFEIIDKAFSQPMRNGVALFADICLMLNALPTHANSRSTHERDLISRADAIAYIDRVIKSGLGRYKSLNYIRKYISALPSADAEPKRVLQGYCKGANTIQTIRHEELKQIANTRKAVESADAVPQMEHDREWIIGCIKHDGFIKTDRFDKANQIILEALSADTSSDLISRANAMAEFREWVKRANENGETPTWNDAVSLIGSLPSADAVHGEWEFVDNEIFAGEYFCSICGKRAEVDLYGEWILSNYCPSCGAIMKGGAE